MVALATLMPIVAGVGGNAGTQTLAVTERAMATNQLTQSKYRPRDRRELRVAVMNGLTVAVVIGLGVGAIFARPDAGRGDRRGDADQHLRGRLAGVLVPVVLERFNTDPAGIVVGVRDHDYRFDGVPGVPRPWRARPGWSADAGGVVWRDDPP